MQSTFSKQRVVLGAMTAVASALLVACGGGGGTSTGDSDKASPTTVTTSVKSSVNTMKPGDNILVAGAAASTTALLQGAGWTVTKLTAGSPDLTVDNANCANARKSDVTNDVTSRSSWNCDLTVVAPKTVAEDSQYRLTFTAVDKAGVTHSSAQVLKVAASASVPAIPPTVETAGAVTALSGQILQLNCDGSGGTLAAGKDYRYRWVVKSNPSAVPLALQGADTDTLTFTAPAVTQTTAFTVECRVTDSTPLTTASPVNVTVEPAPATTPVVTSNAGNNQTVLSQAVVTLDGTGSKAVPAAPQLYYQWRQVSGPEVTIVSPNTAKATFAAPLVTELTPVEFELVTRSIPDAFDYATDSEKSRVTVYVDALAPLSLKVSDAQVLESEDAAVISVQTTPNVAGLHYEWTQIAGPTVTFGGQGTATMSFAAPSVTGAPAQLVFQVAVSRKPLSSALEGEVFFTDAVVWVKAPDTP